MIALIFALIGVLPAYFVAGWYSAVNHIKWFKIGEKKAYGRVYQSQLNTILICNLLIWPLVWIERGICKWVPHLSSKVSKRLEELTEPL